MRCLKSIFFLLIFAPCYALAANGINLIGFGPKSVGMGSADLASIDDSAALQINPAALRNINGTLLDINVSFVTSFNSNHSDMFGSDVDDIVKQGTFLTFGFVDEIDKKSNWGVGLYILGGVGTKIENINTIFGTTDNIDISASSIGLVIGVAKQIKNNLSIGASLILTYSQSDQDFFPNTSDTSGAQPFFGQSVKGADTTEWSYKLGLLYKINSKTDLGFAYSSKKDLALSGNNIVLNMTALGLGKVKYSNVTIDSVNLPQEIGIGISHQINSEWLIATEINWLNWSQSAKNVTINATLPNNAFAPAQIASTIPLEWKDQYVTALGAAYHLGNNKKLLMGFNIANNPVPSRNQSPTLSAIARYHVTMGYTQPWDVNSNISLAVEYQIKEKSTYTNLNQPFGANTGIEFDIFGLHIMYSRHW